MKTPMRLRSATGATDENPKGNSPLACHVWEHGDMSSVYDSDVIFM